MRVQIVTALRMPQQMMELRVLSQGVTKMGTQMGTTPNGRCRCQSSCPIDKPVHAANRTWLSLAHTLSQYTARPHDIPSGTGQVTNS